MVDLFTALQTRRAMQMLSNSFLGVKNCILHNMREYYGVYDYGIQMNTHITHNYVEQIERSAIYVHCLTFTLKKSMTHSILCLEEYNSFSYDSKSITCDGLISRARSIWATFFCLLLPKLILVIVWYFVYSCHHRFHEQSINWFCHWIIMDTLLDTTHCVKQHIVLLHLS